MKIQKYISLCAVVAATSLGAGAQNITFDTDDFQSIGVYDTWENSPFRTGTLAGNVKVVDNHLHDDEANPSAKMLGFQWSHLGSNTYGAKIELKESFELTQTQRYMHVKIHKPVEGRVMLIGLGRKVGRTDQTEDIEQFWSFPINDTYVDEWFDAVFPVKGNGNININQIVIVPYCEEPHTLDSDFAVYLDDVELNDNSKPRVGAGLYPVIFASDTEHGRDDRRTTSVSLTSGTDGSQSITVPSSPYMSYNKLFDTPFKAKAGDNITSALGYQGSWMHGYVYLDKGNDGDFSYGASSSNILDTTTDLMAYSYYSSTNSSTGKNSAGTTVSNNTGHTLPSYTLPSDLTAGFYRMRYKIDWNNIDPAGDESQFITNGGVIVDVLLNVHEDNVTVNQDNRNGEILIASTGASIDNNTIPFGQALKIKMQPANGFAYNGIRVRHGYNLTGDSLIKENPQYRDIIYYNDMFDEDDCFSIPAETVDGNLLIEGLFVEAGTEIRNPLITYNVYANGQLIKTQAERVTPGSDYPTVSIDCETSSDYYTISGIPEGTVGTDDESFDLIVEQNTPFQISEDFNNAHWYKVALTADHNYLTYSSSQTYIPLSSTTVPSSTDQNSQWAFIGNVIDGFMMVNRAAGEGKILSSSTNTSSNTGGSTYPIVRDIPTSTSYNTYWIPTKSTQLSGETGFFLHQKGYPSNRMNSRDSRLAYWTGGADGGSTFTISYVESTSAIDSVISDNADAYADAEYFNLQGVKVNASNLTPGIYVCRQGNKVSKVLVK